MSRIHLLHIIIYHYITKLFPIEITYTNKNNVPDWIRKKVEEKEMNNMVWKAKFNYDGLRRQMNFSNKNRRIKKKPRKQNVRINEQIKIQGFISINPGRINLITAYDEKKKIKILP